MGEEIEDTPVEETPIEKKKKEKKPKSPSEGPFISFTGPKSAPKIIALMGALYIILQGNNSFWTWGVIAPLGALSIACGIFLYILGIILILMIGIIGFGNATLKKIEMVEKFYRTEVLLLLGALIILFEILSVLNIPTLTTNIATIILSSLLGGVLVIIAALLEMKIDDEKFKPSRILVLCGSGYAIIEAIVLFATAITLPNPLPNYWDGIIAIIVVIILLLSMYERIKVIPYEWWMVLILGFILFGWVNPGITGAVISGGVGGTLVLISFILMLLEK